METTKKHYCQGGCCKKKKAIQIPELTPAETEILEDLKKYHYLPLCQFIMCKENESAVRLVALSPVYLRDMADDMATVKQWGAALTSLAAKKIITLDYELPLNGFDYDEYKNSDIYKSFQGTVAEGATKPNFLCNTTELEQGSVGLTDFGQDLIDYIPTPEK